MNIRNALNRAEPRRTARNRVEPPLPGMKVDRIRSQLHFELELRMNGELPKTLRLADRRRRSSTRGFTLVELMIVVVAMAILAGAVIPHLEQAVEDSRQSTMLTSLHQLQTILERYKMEHNGRTPLLIANSLPQLLTPTDKSGNSNPSGPPLGPYLYELPVNPLNDSALVYAADSNPPKAENFVGWIYDAKAGHFWAGLNRDFN